MLDLQQIEAFYPEYLRSFKRNLLREYLQYKILEAIYSSRFADRLSFMGGTSIHVVHGNPRFSEDLDFDNLGLGKDEFEELKNVIRKRLELEGYCLETSVSHGKASHIFLGVKELLYQYGLSTHKSERLHIQIDAEPQGFNCIAEKYLLNKFDVFIKIAVVPCDILLSQKITAILTRKRPMGRDFYDTTFLVGKTRPNLDYLKDKLGLQGIADLKERLVYRCSSLNFNALAKDVEPFLFHPSDSIKIVKFPDLIEGFPP